MFAPCGRSSPGSIPALRVGVRSPAPPGRRPDGAKLSGVWWALAVCLRVPGLPEGVIRRRVFTPSLCVRQAAFLSSCDKRGRVPAPSTDHLNVCCQVLFIRLVSALSRLVKEQSAKAKRDRHGLHRSQHKCESSARHARGAHTELLVDADTHSIAEIRSAMKILQLSDHTLHMTVFGAPGLAHNKRWQQLCAEPNISFQAVERVTSRRGEANDSAIETKVRKLCRSNAIARIGLMVSDRGYGAVMREALCWNKDVVAVCPDNKHQALRIFQELGISVLKVPTDRDSRPRVRAILHKDGNGTVCMAEPRQSYDGWDEEVVVRDFLNQLGYLKDDSRYLIHAAAKFWSTNSLGDLTVFPQQCATEALHALIQGQQRPGSSTWQRPRKESAFVLPKSNKFRQTKVQKRQYGSTLAHSVFQGGGPILLTDSKRLVATVLRKLGYLDANLNKELSEAMLVFCNNAMNKHVLRKLDALPSEADTASAVEALLRQAFLSQESSGQWHVGPKDVELRWHLFKQGFTKCMEASRETVLQAARRYARTHGMSEMKTYNGCGLRIMKTLNTNPNRTDSIEFQLD